MALRPSGSKTKPSILLIIFLSLTFLLLITTFRPKPYRNDVRQLQHESPEEGFHSDIQNPRWYDIVSEDIHSKNIKIGLVNMHESVHELHGLTGTVTVDFERLAESRRWEEFFPEWIDEDEISGTPTCPDIPMPRFEDYGELDVVVARVPWGTDRTEGKGVRDLFRLQVNLVVANLLVSSSWKKHGVDRTVHVVFIGTGAPMLEIFRCDDLVWREEDYRIYRPDLRRLKEKVAMPVGTCQLAPPIGEPGQEAWRKNVRFIQNATLYQPREAYVSVLHSSESYVCGAIALAQSIIRSNSTKDLVLLADDSISTTSVRGLKAAGWKVKRIERIRSPHAKQGSYNEWNYSKLRIWQLVEYDRVIFIDSDLIVLKNVDKFFLYPPLSAVGNDKHLFNSGVILIEPSHCVFETLMKQRFALASYNGGDQGFLNEIFTWWHRWPTKLNRLKMFLNAKKHKHEILENPYMIHYLGLKPWMCYKDYDCNWDMLDHHLFASDSAHWKWWQAYEAMPKKLRPYCALTKSMDARITKWRGRAKNAGLRDGHWKIKVQDPRRLGS
ncbi:hypothetical protein RJ639_009968 [Escallonia herrerae]|uniref:Hexosyltransferase n=1 Tax=Escallonia herrerae TaxID=1293975 RepID=A0AA89AQI0_9ASTE|nr:hypothetical protein RJ639_009968 [Escallonia herrerae]